LGPIRVPEELEQFITYLYETGKRTASLKPASTSRIYNKEWMDILELKNIIHLLEAAARSALFRTESRGVHFREDCPYVDNDRWLKETIIPYNAHEWEITTRTPPITSITPPDGKTPYLEMWKKMMAAHSEVGGHH
jgi:succinate dehydrogenase/fumarate reductase flavoprotein subunit